MKLTISEIADAVGVAPRIVQLRAKDWNFGIKREKGKGLCYYLDALFSSDIPDKWVDALQAKFLDCDRVDLSTNVDVATLIDEDTKPQLLEELEQLPQLLGKSEELDAPSMQGGQERFAMPVESDKSTAVTLARIEIVRMAQKYLMDRKAISPKVKKVACYEQFAEQVESGAIQLPEFVRIGLTTKEGKLKLSRASLTNWEGQSLKELSPKHQGKESFFDLRPDYAIAAEAVSREFGAAANIVQHAFESGIIRELFGLEEIPTYSQIRGWLKKQEETNRQRQRAFRTGDKSVLLPALGSYSRGLKPNDKWEIDSTKADLMTVKGSNLIWLNSPYGETNVRAALVVCIDVATRMVKVLVRPTSNSEALCLVLADCVRDWGVPKVVKTDNGKDYISKHVKGFLAAMGIDQDGILQKKCTVRSPQQKPHVERFNRTLQHSAEWQMLPWSTGHNVETQQNLRKRRDGEKVLPWTIAQFQSWIDKWVDSYHSRMHEGLGMSPFERLASFRAEGFVALMPKNLDQVIEFAMMREEMVTVNKGGISYQGRFYIASELIEYFGQKVAIRFDPDDVNQILVYTTTNLAEAKLICKAKWDMAHTPEEQAKLALVKPAIAEAVQQREKAVKAGSRRIKAELTKHPEKVIRGGGVAALKSIQEVEATTANLISQIEAAANPKIQPIDPDMDERWKAVIAKREEDAKPSEILVRIPQDWLKWWDKPELASEEDLKWMIRTAGMGGYGKAWLTMRRVDVDDAIEILEKRICDRAA